MTFSCFGKDTQTNEQIFFVLVQNNSTSNMLTHAFLMRLESFTGLFYSTVAPVSPAVSGKNVICPQNNSNYLKNDA